MVEQAAVAPAAFEGQDRSRLVHYSGSIDETEKPSFFAPAGEFY